MWLLRYDATWRYLKSLSLFAITRKCSQFQGKMSNLYVRCLSDSDRMQMSFNFGLPGKKEKSFNLNRLKSEELGKCLERISLGISKFLASKKKKRKDQDDDTGQSEVNVCLFDGDSRVDECTTNVEAWLDGSRLKLNDYEYSVLVNVPTVTSLTLPQNIMAGFPVFPKYDLEFAEVEECVFTWSKSRSIDCSSVGGSTVERKSEFDRNSLESADGCSEFKEAGCGLYYTPSVDDIGCQIKLSCEPVQGRRRGEIMTAVSTQVVDAGPGLCPFEDRHSYTMKSTMEGCLRMVSYNVLADYYADSDFSREHLFPQCPPYALNIDYRKQLFLKEILGYNADLICLQEMDKRVFHSDLSPALHLLGYKSLLKQKAGQVPEGCAMFFRESKLKLVAQHDIDFSDSLGNDEAYEDLLEAVSRSEPLKTNILAKSTTLQVAVLDYVERPGKKLVAMNTHFYFHPKSAHIRLIHSAMAMRHMEYVCELYKDATGEPPAVVFCGDFNSTPETGFYTFITDNRLMADHPDWWAEGGEEYFGGLDIQHNYKKLLSACETPAFTNFTCGFRGCLDYIFIDSKHLETEQIIPLPSEEVVTQHIALPNIVFPSDHLALVCDVKWKD